jgi:acyl-CoA dehydrogenase
VAWWTRLNSLDGSVSDATSHKVAQLIQQDSEQRDRLTEGIYMPKDPEEALSRLDLAFKMVKKAEGVEKKIKNAIRAKTLPKKRIPQVMEEALQKNVITQEEFDTIKKAQEMRDDAIQVDSFTQERYMARKG